MSSPGIDPVAPPPPEVREVDWRVRTPARADVAGICAGIRELLLELGGTPPPLAAMEAATEALLDDAQAGVMLVAEADSALVGVLAASWQTAIHAAGRYALIQDLWVEPSWRSRALGGALLQALFKHAAEQGITRIEVGLPQEDFAGLDATEAFYRGNGFVALGPRMRRVLE